LVIILIIFHLFTHDYSFENGYSKKFKYTISLNCIIIVSILFASRVSTSLHSFAIVLLGIVIFQITPFFRQYLRIFSFKFYLIFTIILFLTTSILLLDISLVLSILFISISLIISFITPLIIIYLQRYKNVIVGKWDKVELN
jgi:phosphatidylinositol N-acetylglucosaminyltransferase subunit C